MSPISESETTAPTAPIVPAATDPAAAEYALGLGDDALILAQRLGEWISRAPELEEDLALANIALDLLGHARALLTYAGSATNRSEDDLAYLRDESEFRCRQLFEQPRGDFAVTIVRQLVASVYFDALYRELAAGADPTLAAIATKAVKEIDYHLDHSTQWLLRLALGTEESRTRTVAALDAVWPFVGELFDTDPAAEAYSAAVDPATLSSRCQDRLGELLGAAQLELPQSVSLAGGGRRGVHSEAFGPLLAEMQSLARRHPGATW